jgi:recombination protein RecA
MPERNTMEDSKKQKFKAVEQLDKSLTKQFKNEGKTFQRMGKNVGRIIPHIPTNLPSVDREVLGCGGIPRGRVIEIFGPESSGKTAFCLHIIAECQKAGGVCAFIDAEHALSPTFANTLGVNMDELIISQPDCGEEALEIVIGLVEAKAVDFIVVDSVTALVPRAELDGDMGDSHMGLQARLMSQCMRKLVGIAAKNGVSVAFINQIREKVGLVFGSPEVTTGGRALKFYASVRLEVRRVAGSKGGTLKEGDLVYGHKINIKAVKNKVAMPFRECQIDLFYESGFQCDEDLFQHALKIGVLTGTAKFAIVNVDGKGTTGNKLDKDTLLSADNISTLRAAVDRFYADKMAALLSTTEESDEETDEESEADSEG